jgi:hypothetical protein
MKSLILLLIVLSPSVAGSQNQVGLSWTSQLAMLESASEPTAALLLGLGLLTAGCLLRRRGKLASRSAE